MFTLLLHRVYPKDLSNVKRRKMNGLGLPEITSLYQENKLRPVYEVSAWYVNMN